MTLDVFLRGLIFLKHPTKEKLPQETGADVTYERKASNNMNYPNDFTLFYYLLGLHLVKKKLRRLIECI